MSCFRYRGFFIAAAALLYFAQTQEASAVVALELDDVVQEVGAFSYAGEWEGSSGSTAASVSQLGVYLHAGYAVTQNWEAFVRIGAADLVIEKGFSDKKTDFSGEYRPFGTLGMRGSLVTRRNFDLGMFVDASYFIDYSDEQTVYLSGDTFPGSGLPPDLVAAQEEIAISQQWSANLGVTAAVKFSGFALYGGPVAYWRQAQIQADRITVDGDHFSGDQNDTLNEKGVIGLLGGVEIPIGKIGTLRFEAQQKSDLSLSGAFTYLKFQF